MSDNTRIFLILGISIGAKYLIIRWIMKQMIPRVRLADGVTDALLTKSVDL